MDNGASSYRRFLDGDQSGFDELIINYRDSLIYFINGFLNNLDESEDVAEEAFMELIVHPHRYSFRSSFKTYLFTVARNKAVDRVRKEKKLSPAQIEDMDLEDISRLEHSILKDENSQMLRKSMEKINPEYAAVLRLLYFEDMTSEQVGKILKKNKRQIANLTYRAKNSLRRAMEEEGFSYEEL
ncbi:MAG: RNA polymerase sigma factor [Ruminococcaceae bacterium]|nr:RNA polymerase sigma factor [Oscillospiraceae bacterium]